MENLHNLPQKEIIIEDKLDWLKYLYETFHDEIIFNTEFESNQLSPLNKHNNYDIHETCIDFFTIKHDSVNCLKYIREHFINNFNSNHVSNSIIFYSIKCLKFIIGGPYGLNKKNNNLRINEKISLSKMTFSHQMIRIFILEQIYRSLKIMNNEPYHNE